MFTAKEYKPSRALAPFVASYSSAVFNIEARPDTTFKIVPNGCLELIIHLKDTACKLPNSTGLAGTPDYMLIGLFRKAYNIHFTEKVPIFSIRFKPEALSGLLGIQGSEILESYEDIETLLGKNFRDFCHRIREDRNVGQMIQRTESFLKNILLKQQQEEDYVQRATTLIRNAESNSIREISERLSISQRQLERKFSEVIGISPKRYLRLMRFNKVMQALQQKQFLNLTSVAYYCGYFDQAHFIKDFKHITGHSPGIYIKERQRFIHRPSY